jgi:hemolysin activation/secretion protein
LDKVFKILQKIQQSKKITLALALAVAFCCSLTYTVKADDTPGITQQKAMDKIIVFGNQNIDTLTIQKNLAGLDAEKMKETALQLYQTSGYEFVRVEVLTTGDDKQIVYVNETILNKIHIEGNTHSPDSAVLDALPELKENEPVNIRKLSGQILLANENAFRKMAVNFRTAGNDKVDAYVTVEEKESSKTILAVDNTGSEYTGHWRAHLTYIDGNAGGKGHTAAVSFSASPGHFKDVKQFGLYYNVPLPHSKDNVYFTATYSDVDSGTIINTPAYSVNATGRGSSFGLHYVKNLMRSETTKENFSFGLDYNQYKNDSSFAFKSAGESFPLGVDLDSLPLRLTYSKNKLAANESVSYSVSLVQNIPGGGKNSDSRYNTHRAGAKADYRLWRANANHQRLYPSGWLTNISLNAQYANQRLTYYEQMGLGGTYSIRGIDERYVAGDKAIRASFELYTPEIAKGQRLLAFVDTGHFANVDPQSGELAAGTATSAGIGWRYNNNGFSVAADWGYLLKGVTAKERHESKFHLSISKMF